MVMSAFFRFLKCCFFASFLLTIPTVVLASAPTMTGAQETLTIPPVPTYSQMPLPESQTVAVGKGGVLEWIGSKPLLGAKAGCWPWELVLRRWNPSDGSTEEFPLGLKGHVLDQIGLASARFFVSTTGCEDGSKTRVSWMNGQAHVSSLVLRQRLDDLLVRLVPLNNDSLAIVTREKTSKFVMVYVIRRFEGRWVEEAMPVLAMPFNRDFAFTALDPNRILIIGGSNATYRGCNPCRAETHILDLTQKAWSVGPSMLEPRSELSAGLLPDGSVLVTGGWTPSQDWGYGPSRTAELLNPSTMQFERAQPMPTATSMHRSQWMPGREGKTLLIFDGTNGSVQAFDVASKTWRTAASWRQGSEEGGCGFFPFIMGNTPYAWGLIRSEGFYSDKSCMDQKYASLSTLRFGDEPAQPPESLLVTRRGHMAFVAAKGLLPALAIAGSIHGGMNSYLPTATVDAVGLDGRFWAMPTLITGRTGAVAYRFGTGVLVLGGVGEPSRRDNKDDLPTEWLSDSRPGSGAIWVSVPGVSVNPTHGLAQMQDGSLLELDGTGGVQKITARVSGSGVLMQRSAWPRLNRARLSSPSSREDQVVVRELPDGRVVVAGGLVQSEQIALYKPDINLDTTVDEYVGVGVFLESSLYEIFDPGTMRWSNSAPSRFPGGKVAILADGRVLKVTQRQVQEMPTPRWEPVFELSNAQGSAWMTLAADQLPGFRALQDLVLYEIDGELFASDTNHRAVQWFNPTNLRWEVVWSAGSQGDNWRDNAGRMLVRTLVNGKTLVLPVGEGL